METLVVGYDRKGQLMVVRACLFGVLMGFAFTAIGFLDRNPGSINLIVIVFLAKFLGPLTIVLCVSLAISTICRRGPALVVDGRGLTVGFLPVNPLRLTWDEVAHVSRTERLVQNQLIETLVVQPWDEPALVARLGWRGSLFANVAVLTGQPIVGIGLRLLDQSWEEIEAAVSLLRPRAASRESGVHGDDIPANLRAEAEAAMTSIRRMLTRDGDLLTLEDFRRVFRRAPLGCWSDSLHGSSPGDSSVGFCVNGTGWASHGAAGFMGYDTETRWRERDEDFAIDVRRDDEDSEWQIFDYGFLEHEGGIVINMVHRISGEPDDEKTLKYDPMNDPDEWTAAFFALMKYDGPCRNDRRD